ncbi:MAG: O-antigen ligase family protein [Bacteroidota bacterium]
MSDVSTVAAAPMASWRSVALAVLGLAAIIGGTAIVPNAAIALPAALALTAAGVAVATKVRPSLTAGFVVLICMSIAAQGNDEGTDIFEIAFGLSLISYVLVWYGTTVIGGRRWIRNGVDVALFLYLLGSVTVGIGVGVLLGSFGTDFRSDLTCLLALALFFPTREICVRSRHGVAIVTGLILMLGLYAAAVNAATLFGTLSGATELYEVVDVRVSSGEIPMTASLLVALAALTAVTTRWGRLALLAVVIASIGGLILAKSRGPWITAIIGAGVAGTLVPARSRWRLIAYFALAGGLTVAAALVVLGNELFLIGIGLLRRFASISGAATGDISLINRYAESAATWAEIIKNPVLGYGWGAPVSRYDMIVEGTHHWGFVHNGYLWMWHKVGIWGLALFSFAFAGTAWHGIRASRRALTPVECALAAGGVGALVAYAILALPSNPFVVPDQMLAVTLVLGLVSGTFERARTHPAPS